MARHSALVRFVLLGSLLIPASAFAQFPPPAGSAGAGVVGRLPVSAAVVVPCALTWNRPALAGGLLPWMRQS